MLKAFTILMFVFFIGEAYSQKKSVTKYFEYNTSADFNKTHASIGNKNYDHKLSRSGQLVDSTCLDCITSSAINSGLVVCLPFNGDASDLAGMDNNGTVIGATLTSDRFGNANSAYSFNGTSDYINVTVTPELLTNEYTYSAWVKFNTMPPPASFLSFISIGGALMDQIIGYENFPGYTGLGFAAGSYNDQGGVSGGQSTIVPVIGTWYHIASTRDNTSIKLYINGILTASSTTGANAGYDPVSTFHVGARCDPYISDFGINGIIDDIRIYKRVLDANEINQIYSSTNCNSIINSYTPVFAFAPCTNKITVEDASTFSVGDTVLMIQMKGAVIDSSNTSNFGTITDYKNAGNYEFNYVKSKTGNIIELKNKLTRQYDIPNGKVQLVRVPYYQSLNVNSTLSCLPWDGSKGGVLVLNVQDTITLNADIDVSGKGFHGGVSVPNQDCPDCENTPGYFYPISADVTGEKGEGVFFTSNSDFAGGKGAIANGGGSGVCKNGGGGGGSNFGFGGIGGLSFNGCSGSSTLASGLGGYALNNVTSQNKIFLGGGGGAGEADNTPPVATNGTNGGGIIIIRSGVLISNGQSITSNGMDQNLIAQWDGGGGGGAGGSVLLDINIYSGITNIYSTGGKGSDNNSNNYPEYCHSPGGGGGGGLVWFKQGIITAGITVSTSGGVAGKILNSASACAGTTYGASKGTNGSSLFNLQIPFDTIPFKPNIDSVRIRDSVVSCSTYYFNGLAHTNINAISNWQWYFGDGGTANTQNTSHTYTAAGIYAVKLIVTDNNGCKDNTTKNVTGSFQIVPASDTAICAGNSITLSVNVAQSINDTILPPGSQFEYTFNTPAAGWTTTIGGWITGNAPFGNETNGLPPEFNYNTYWPSGVAEGGDGFDLRIRRTINLAGYNLSTIRWYLGVDNGFVLYLNGIRVDSATADGYTDRWEYNGIIPAAILNADNNIIAVGLSDDGEATAFDMMITGERINSGVSVLWSTGDTTTTINVTPTQTTTYFVAVANGTNICTDSIKVVVKPSSAQTVNAAICQGENYLGYTVSGIYIDTLNAVNVCDSIRTINLIVKPKSVSTITQSICPGQNIEGYTNSGTYIDTLVAANGCDSIRTIKLTLIPKPVPDLGIDKDLCPGDSLVLYPGQFNSYQWQDGSAQKSITVKRPGLYSVAVSNICGSAKDEILIKEMICDVWFPSAFTPNNDGKNDLFKVLGAHNLSDFQLVVYNRWGQKIFETNDFTKGWPGTINGKEQDSGVFVWYCEFKKNGNADKIKMKGTVLLIR